MGLYDLFFFLKINNQILYGYTPGEIDKIIKSCNGKMLLEILRKTTSEGPRNFVFAPPNLKLITTH